MMRIASLARPVALVALGICLGLPPAAADEPSAKDVLKTYADIAAAGYADSLATARTLQLAVNQLLANPTDQNMLAARAAWVAARIPYMQTEAYRFGNKIVDDWEGKVNSWPLDEGLIDYVSASYGIDSAENDLYTANVVANNVGIVLGTLFRFWSYRKWVWAAPRPAPDGHEALEPALASAQNQADLPEMAPPPGDEAGKPH